MGQQGSLTQIKDAATACGFAFEAHSERLVAEELGACFDAQAEDVLGRGVDNFSIARGRLSLLRAKSL
jgi:hypothetical protein